jgi:hypothetical protein
MPQPFQLEAGLAQDPLLLLLYREQQ